MISEKLDILMNITDTRNNTLARALSFDPSYVGRIRTGKRGIPKHMPFIEPAAAFFARNINTDYQRKIISEIICDGKPLPKDQKKLEKLLAIWLREDNQNKPDTSSIDLILHELSSANPPISPAAIPDLEINYDEKKTEVPPIYFYGNSGKREATEKFLGRLCADGNPHTLLLFSDEDMTWLYEDPIFARKWAAYLIQLLSTGSRIKIIHTINRNLNDLIEAVQKWMPLYMAGDIEPYYYPRIRDGIYHRTLFIAKDEVAITSNSIGSETTGMPNILIEEPKAINGLEKEFNNFLSLCVPLMKIYKNTTRKIRTAINRFKNAENEIYFLEAVADSTNKSNAKYIITINSLVDELTNVTKINSTGNRIPENISIIANINSGVLVITDRLIFDTAEPNFTMTFLEYLSKL